ncbi:MAG: SDR family NAD(P)-dependent oxidoreductase [Polyangiaceae bacterium]
MQRKVIVVTGGTSGIGLAAAKELAAKGHRVFVAGRRARVEDPIERVANGGTLESLPLDVTKSESIDAAVRIVAEKTDGYGIDVLVNNAGYATAGPILEMSEEALRAQFETNVFGLVAVTRRFAEAMIDRKNGRIVNIGSVSGRIPAPVLGAYHATKYALEALNDAMRMELGAFGIDVALVDPGTIKTEFAGRTIAEALAHQERGTRYGAAFANISQLEARFGAMAASTKHTSRAILHAALSSHPCTRYVAPRRFWLAIVLFTIIPARIYDAVARSAFGLTRRKLLGAAS